VRRVALAWHLHSACAHVYSPFRLTPLVLCVGLSLVQEHEPSADEMSKCFLFRPGFVEGFPVDFKPFLMPNERSKGAR